MEGAITVDTRRWNDVQHYTHIGTYFGYNDSNLPEDAVFSLEDNEAVYELVVPYDATPMEKVVSILDETDYAILEETARSKYLTCSHSTTPSSGVSLSSICSGPGTVFFITGQTMAFPLWLKKLLLTTITGCTIYCH